MIPRTILRRALKPFWSRCWLLSGQEVHSNAPVNLFFSGREQTRHYLRRLVFESGCQVTELGIRRLTDNTFRKAYQGKRADLLIVESGGLQPVFSGILRNALNTPLWVHADASVDETLNHLHVNKNLLGDLRRIRSNKLKYSLSHDLNELHFLYDEMYIPHTLMRHAERALPRSLENLADNWGNRVLIKIETPEGEWIGGSIIEVNGDLARSIAGGIKRGDMHYARIGAIAAQYYFELKYLAERGVTSVDYGASRGFVNDGVLQYKKKWGGRLTSCSREQLLISPLHNTEPVKSFLDNNPIVQRELEGYVSTIFASSPESLVETLDGRIRHCRFCDDQKVRIYTDANASYVGELENLENVELRQLDALFPCDGGR